MSDIDCHSEITSFHRECVTLSNKQQGEMRTRRDAGRIRLKNGLTEADKPQPREVCSQGSYQMRTMVQDDENDYDIDDGAYFSSDDLNGSDGAALMPLGARERVCDALKWDGRLKQEATVKNNCVRQEYSAGYHIDVPVYRIVSIKDENNNQVEHYELASGDDWVESDARAVTRWFNGLVGELNYGEADGSQLRRITKLSKKFARRPEWKKGTTSGICITKLVVDNFQSSTDRDDKSLRETWNAIDKKLQISTQIGHPVLPQNLASAGDEEVGVFRDCLHDALKTLQVLDDDECTLTRARDAWDEVFNTTFFSNQPDNDDDQVKGALMGVTSTQTARRNDGGGRFG
jgi:hypothetical protein